MILYLPTLHMIVLFICVFALGFSVAALLNSANIVKKY
jgi:hypothetical protein